MSLPAEAVPRVVIVTGASRGIGAATALGAARAGYAVCVNYLAHEARARAVAERIRAGGGRAITVQTDVGDEVAVRRMFDVTEEELGRVTALVNNAGTTGGFARVDQVSGEQILAALRVNVLGSLLCAGEAARRMSTHRGGRGGVIVNISSTASRTGGTGEWVHYAATKGAIDTFTRGAARELAGEGIRVNAVAPGLVLTDLHADNGQPDRPERLAGTIPMGRLGTPEEVASAILWVLSEQASYVTGAVLEVSGGR